MQHKKPLLSWHRLIRKSITSDMTGGVKAETSVWHTGKDWADHIYPWTEGKFRYLFVLLMLNLQTEWCYVLDLVPGLRKANDSQRNYYLIPLPGMALSHPKLLNPKEYPFLTSGAAQSWSWKDEETTFIWEQELNSVLFMLVIVSCLFYSPDKSLWPVLFISFCGKSLWILLSHPVVRDLFLQAQCCGVAT